MLRFFLKRLLMAIPTIVIVAVLVFVLVRLIPGDPAELMLGDMATPDQVAHMRGALGLDQNIAVQFITWAGKILTGDFGTSISTGQPVFPLIMTRFGVSSQIVLLAVLFASLIAVPAGMIAAWKQDSGIDFAFVGIATLLLSVPPFWLGLLLLLLFGLKLGWLPVIGYISITADLKAGLIYMILPVLTLILHNIGILVRMSRASTIEVLRMDYITHARAKGLSESAVLWRHSFKNAFAPTLTVIGLTLGSLLGGIAVIETVFTIPGLGRLLVDSIFQRDYPVIQGCLLFIAVVYVLINLTVDLLYPLFDPKVVAE